MPRLSTLTEGTQTMNDKHVGFDKIIKTRRCSEAGVWLLTDAQFFLSVGFWLKDRLFLRDKSSKIVEY